MGLKGGTRPISVPWGFLGTTPVAESAIAFPATRPTPTTNEGLKGASAQLEFLLKKVPHCSFSGVEVGDSPLQTPTHIVGEGLKPCKPNGAIPHGLDYLEVCGWVIS